MCVSVWCVCVPIAVHDSKLAFVARHMCVGVCVCV